MSPTFLRSQLVRIPTASMTGGGSLYSNHHKWGNDSYIEDCFKAGASPQGST